MSLVLHRFALSGHSHRAELFLRLLGLPYDGIDVDLLHGAHKRPEFLALNPFGQVPVLVADGVPISDSNAILVYLALRHGGDDWLPRDPVGAARVQRWLSVAAGPLAYGAAAARVSQVFKRPSDPQAVERAHALLKTMEGQLGPQGLPYLAAARATVADISLYSYTARAPEGNVSLDDYPQVRAWLARIEALPGFLPMPVSRVGLAA